MYRPTPPGIVGAHAKPAVPRSDDRSCSSISDLKSERIFGTADPSDDPDQRLIGSHLAREPRGTVAAIVQRLRRCSSGKRLEDTVTSGSIQELPDRIGRLSQSLGVRLGFANPAAAGTLD